MKRENNQGLDKTYIYEYNGIGNLTAVKAYPFTLSTTPTGTPVTTSFGYTDDRLTSFGGATIAYNSMGCPTSYEGQTATWSKGRLSRLSQGDRRTGTDRYSYVYNAFGQRVSRSYAYTEGTSESEAVQIGQLTAYTKNYHYDHAGRLIAENTTQTLYGEGTASENIVFLYDESGVIGMELTTGGATNLYYFQRNLQGDVVAIYDTNGTLKAKYLYDAWGNCTISSETTDYTVANANPIRYRGYYYDDDTGLYYCNARYYSPKWRRFISPDDTAYLDPESVNGLNLYCYCGNDPVNYADPSGHFVISIGFLLASAAIGAAVGAVLSGATAYAQGERDWDLVWDIVGGAVFGAAIGATAALGGAAGLGAVANTAVTGTIKVTLGTAVRASIVGMAFASATKYSLDCASSSREWTWGGYLFEALQGGLQGVATFYIAYLGGKAGLFNNKIGKFSTWCDFYIGYGGMNNLKMVSYLSNLIIGPTLSKLLFVSGVGAGVRWVIDQLIPEY